MAQQATATARNPHNVSNVAGLARFFPDATPIRMRFELARQVPGIVPSLGTFTESIVGEFATSREVLFECNTSLEFGDVVRLRNSDGSFDVTASVVAVQYQTGKAVVAARFKHEVPNWIVKS